MGEFVSLAQVLEKIVFGHWAEEHWALGIGRGCSETLFFLLRRRVTARKNGEKPGFFGFGV
ncbi:hypothetical protein C7B67_17005 [filamentous cyanobacterium Phorm 6]|nr:hypothetical protein C7B67_17005 [filamentous cyanobacterium Phorm 6]